MEPSPLTQQARPEVFQPKIVELYEVLFKVGSGALEQPPIAMLSCFDNHRKTTMIMRRPRASGESSSSFGQRRQACNGC
jgi:hypothetical protein